MENIIWHLSNFLKFDGTEKRCAFWKYVVFVYIFAHVLMYDNALFVIFFPFFESGLGSWHNLFLIAKTIIFFFLGLSMLAALSRRLRDVGVNPWLSVLGLVPIANLYVVYLTTKGSIDPEVYAAMLAEKKAAKEAAAKAKAEAKAEKEAEKARIAKEKAEAKEEKAQAEVKEAPKAEAKEAPKAEVKEAPKAEVKEAPKAEVKEAPKAEAKEAPKAEVKEAPKAEVKEAPKAEAKEAPKAEAKEAPKAEVKEAPKAEAKEAPKATEVKKESK